MNLMMLLEMTASGFPDRIVLTHGADRFSASELYAAAGRAAAQIRASGAAQVAFLDVSSPALPVALFASAWAGVPFVPLNYRLTGVEVDRLIDQIRPCYLVADAGRARELGEREGVHAVASGDFLARARGGAARGRVELGRAPSVRAVGEDDAFGEGRGRHLEQHHQIHARELLPGPWHGWYN